MTTASKAGVDTNFEKQIRALRTQMNLGTDAAGVQQGDWSKAQWMAPAGWSGDPFDLEGMTTPFQRDQANQWFLDAVKDSSSSGVVGDGIVSSVQIDYLACLERSFRIRHTMRRPRAFAHATARQIGLSVEEGVFTQALNYIQDLIKQSSLAQPPVV